MVKGKVRYLCGYFEEDDYNRLIKYCEESGQTISEVGLMSITLLLNQADLEVVNVKKCIHKRKGISFRVSEKVYMEFSDRAAKSGCSISNLVRIAVIFYLKKQGVLE